MKIGTKLIIAFLIISSLIGVIGYLSYSTVSNALEESVGIRSMETSNQMMNRIESNLFNHVELFQLFVEQEEIQKELIVSNEAYAKLENPQQLIDKLDNEWISQPKNVQTTFMLDLIDNQLSGKFREHQTYYKEKFGYNFLGELFVTNAFGANVAQSGKTSDFKQNDEDWWQNAKSYGMYISPIEYDDSAEIYARDISLRIQDSEGNFLGVMKFVVNVKEIFVILDEVNLTKKFETQEVTLLDNNYNVIYTTKVIVGNTDFLNKFQNVSILEQLIGKEGYFKQFLDTQKNEKLISFVTSSDDLHNENMNWTLIMEYDTNEILKPVKDLKLSLQFITSITTLGAIVFGFYISRSISKPISLLRNAMKKMEKGDFSKHELSKSNNEIGELGNNFLKMSEEIKKIMKLEKDLTIEKERTKNERLIAIGETSSRMAHDLRNPLSVISNEIEIMKLREPNPTEKMQKSQNRINQSIERMTHQIENVMDFVRTKPLDTVDLILNDLIREQIKSLVLPSEIKINLPEDECVITCDPVQMGIVFYNLIFNSVQAIGNYGEINIKVFENLENITIEFQDSGSGIPEKNLESIFEPLFTTKQTGTGLGLASCRTIIKQHNGTISVKNNPTTFTVMIPKIMKKVEKECLV